MGKGNISIEVKKNQLGKLAAKSPTKASQIVRRTALRVKEVAAPFTPYDTGKLSGDVTTTMQTKFLAVVRWNATYAIFQNYGTRYIAANGFAEKAVAILKPEFQSAIKEAFKL